MKSLPPSRHYDDRFGTLRSIVNDCIGHRGGTIIATARLGQVSFQVSRICSWVNSLECDIGDVCLQRFEKLGPYPDSDVTMMNVRYSVPILCEERIFTQSQMYL